jgi:large subunit ribosomal protein L30
MAEKIEKKKKVTVKMAAVDAVVDTEAATVCSKKTTRVCKKTRVGDNTKSVLCVKQIGSSIGCTESQTQSLRGLGLGKIGKKVVLADNGCVRGLIRKVSHLVKVGCVNE